MSSCACEPVQERTLPMGCGCGQHWDSSNCIVFAIGMPRGGPRKRGRPAPPDDTRHASTRAARQPHDARRGRQDNGQQEAPAGTITLAARAGPQPSSKTSRQRQQDGARAAAKVRRTKAQRSRKEMMDTWTSSVWTSAGGRVSCVVATSPQAAVLPTAQLLAPPKTANTEIRKSPRHGWGKCA